MSEAWEDRPASLPSGPGNRALVEDWAAWAIATMAIWLAPVSYIVDALDIPSSSLTTVISVGAFASLRRKDIKSMADAGFGKGPSVWWFLLFPGYLWQRATILGDDKRMFWCSVGSIVLAFVLMAAADPSVRHRIAGARLSCSDVADDVKDIFNDMDFVKRSGIKATSVKRIEETGDDGAVRSCSATAMQGGGYPRELTYTLRIENGQTMIRVVVSDK